MSMKDMVPYASLGTSVNNFNTKPLFTMDDPPFCPVGISKLSRSLIPTKKQLVEKSVIERLEEVKAIVISYDLWMSRKTEEIFLLMAHYCTG